MPQPVLSKEDAELAVRTLEKYLSYGKSAFSMAANELGIAPPTMRNRVHRAKQLYGIEPQEGRSEPPEQPHQQQRHRDEAERLRAELKEAHRELNELEDLRKVAFGLTREPLVLPKWTTQVRKGKRQQETPVLFTSDFQFGELVKPDEVDGLNEYSVAIAKARYELLIEKTLELSFEHTASPDYPGIIVLRGGDSISGGIHDELAETDELKPNPAIKELAGMEIQGINHLADAFGRVHVISVPGNHGRQTKKPRAKQYADTNADDLLAWFLEMHYASAGDRRVTFYTPRSGDAYFPLGKLRFLLTHGDRIGSRGGQGFIGPAATILRGIYKTRQQYHQVGKHIDLVLLGHFHTSMYLPQSHCLVNGSLSGFTEYAKQLRVAPYPASQWLFNVHPQHGITLMREVFVSELGAEIDPTPAWAPAHSTQS